MHFGGFDSNFVGNDFVYSDPQNELKSKIPAFGKSLPKIRNLKANLPSTYGDGGSRVSKNLLRKTIEVTQTPRATIQEENENSARSGNSLNANSPVSKSQQFDPNQADSDKFEITNIG